jgi:hypothetical protein
MTEPDANRLVAMLMAAWPRAVPEDRVRETAAMYRAGLGDLEFDEALRAVGEAVRQSRFLPTVAELCERVSNARELKRQRHSLPAAPLKRMPGEVEELCKMVEDALTRLR